MPDMSASASLKGSMFLRPFVSILSTSRLKVCWQGSKARTRPPGPTRWPAMMLNSPQFAPTSMKQSPSSSRSTRSEEHTSELQSLMRISYAVFCLKKKKKITKNHLRRHKQIIETQTQTYTNKIKQQRQQT